VITACCFANKCDSAFFIFPLTIYSLINCLDSRQRNKDPHLQIILWK
jgi:hypothetical protein